MRLIDADEVIKAIDRHTFDTVDGLCLDEDITIILEELPSVSIEQIKWERDTAIQQLRELGYDLGQKPKKGKWLPEESNSPLPTLWWRCSVCNGRTFAVEFDKPPLCPHCGARMEVDDAGDL